MKNLVLILAMVFGFGAIANAQSEKVTWETEVTKLSDDTYKIDLVANVAEGWYIYSKDMEQGGPIPTSVRLTGEGFETTEALVEEGENVKEFYDDIFEIDIKKYSGEVAYTQVVKVTSSAPVLKARVMFMSCNDERCLPPRRVTLPISLEK